MSNDLPDDFGTLGDLFVGIIFLRKTHLTLALEVPLLEHLLTLLVVLQARDVAELELGVRGDIRLGSEDHHVANVAPADEWVAAVVDVGSADPDTDRA